MTDHFESHGHSEQKRMYACDVDLWHAHTTNMTTGKTNMITNL